MAVNLQKGQKVDLRKSDGSALKHVMIGLSWDAVKRPGGFLGGMFGQVHDIDCDATAFL